MQTYIIILTSITYVYKAQRFLSDRGINARILKMQANKNQRGCGYALEVSESHLYEATRLIENNRIRIVEIRPYNA